MAYIARAPRARWWLVLAALLLPAGAEAQRRVDFFQGPVVSSNRVIGMGGAFVAVAEGADGHLVNPASFTTRYAHTAHDFFDWDWALSWLNVKGGDDVALDRSGREGTFDEAGFVQVGADLKLGRHGFGLHFATQSYTVARDGEAGPAEAEYEQVLGGLGYAYAFADGEWNVGVLIVTGTATLTVDQAEGEDEDARAEGSGLMFGVLWSPHDAPWRLGATLRSQVEAVGKSQDGHALAVPSEIGLGASYLIADRPATVRPTYGEGDASVATPRGGLLLAADLILTGASDDAIGVQAFLAGDDQRAGRNPTVGARLGAEVEVLPDFVVLRGGSYWEPSRFDAQSGRVHGTAGGDVHLGRLWWDWKLSAALDLASQYVNLGLGVGFWH